MLTGDLIVTVINRDRNKPAQVMIEDMAYGDAPRELTLGRAGKNNASASVTLRLQKSFGWHDLRVRVAGAPAFERRCAGRVETGREGFSDPLMGRA